MATKDVVVTEQDISDAQTSFQEKVAARKQAEADYAAVVAPFSDKRKALRVAHDEEADADKVLADLLTKYVTPNVPPVPTDS